MTTDHPDAIDPAEPRQTTAYDGAVVSGIDAIKALTHPLRIRLLDLFRSGVELTATECAERTGESVASCSFHLRQLEKYGFIERAEPRGKERPWRTVANGYAMRPDLSDPEALAAGQAFLSTWLTEQFTKLHRWTENITREDPEWLYATTQTFAEFWATREELYELSRQIEDLTDKFRERSANPELRPDGARHAQLLGAVWADIEPADDAPVKAEPADGRSKPASQ